MVKNRIRDLIILFTITITIAIPILSSSSPADNERIIISRVDRRIDLTSQLVRITSTLKLDNAGPNSVSQVLLAVPDKQADNLSFFTASRAEGKGRAKGPAVTLPVAIVHRQGTPPAVTLYAVSLPEDLAKGQTITIDTLAVYTHALTPFPEKITQADPQLVVFQDSAYVFSPYTVKVQTLTVKLPHTRIESYTKLESTKIQGSEIKYGPFHDRSPFSYSPIVAHFENNHPFAVAQELLREIEVSHWGNVQITEHYKLVHGGAQSKGEFSRLDYQARPHIRGASAFKNLVAKLPPRAHSVYYRDEIGNISTSNLWSDLKKTELLIEPRYPMFGGWKTSFTIGYGLPLEDYLFQSEGKRVLNITFGCPIAEVVIDKLTVKVVLPEGSKDISVSVPFSIKELQETKFSHLDVVGRPVVVLEKANVVHEHNQHFQVYYKFNNISLLMEPLMLISWFLFLFAACIVYMHSDMSISKSSPSYIAKLQWDEVQTTIEGVENIMNRCLGIHEKLETSLRDLSRSGDIAACKAARKTADGLLKEAAKELKPLISFLQTCPQATHILGKVEEVVGKERELEEKVMTKHATVVEVYEKKSGGREVENRVASQQQKIRVLQQEVDDLLEVIREI